MISPTREFIKEGKIKLISPSSGDIIDRYIFLVMQLCLLCTKMSVFICAFIIRSTFYLVHFSELT